MNAITFIGAAMALAAPATKNSPTEPAPIVGIWAVESMKVNGRDTPILTPWEWEFSKDGRWIVRTAGKQNPGERKYNLNEKPDPAAIDLIGDNGENPSEAIFRIEGDVLTVCVAPGKRNRPAALDSPKGSGNFLYTYKRQKKD
jgi:uncharacterized protein (TIGR03067 family)